MQQLCYRMGFRTVKRLRQIALGATRPQAIQGVAEWPLVYTASDFSARMSNVNVIV